MIQMKYYSDVTNKMYETIDELAKAEEAVEIAQKEEEKKRAEKKVRISEIEEKINGYTTELESIVEDYKVTSEAYRNACADLTARYRDVNNKIAELKREKAKLSATTQSTPSYNDFFTLFDKVFC